MANRFWVGGSGTWDASATTHWASVSGGSSGASAPIGTDNVTIDGSSGSGTITTAAGAVTSALAMNSANISLSLGANMANNGLLTLTMGTITLNSFTLTCTTISSSNSNTRSFAFGTGKIVCTQSNTTIIGSSNCVGLTLTGSKLVECNYAGGTGNRIFSMGNPATGATESNCYSISITAGTDIIDITTSRYINSLDLTGFAGTVNINSQTLFGNFTLSTGVTIGTVTGVTFGATSGTKTITTAGKTCDFPITFNGIGGTFQFQDALTQGSTRAFTMTNGDVQLKNGVTTTTGVFTTSGTNPKLLSSSSAGNFATLTQASGTANMTYLTIKDIHATGGAQWNALTQAFPQTGNSGIYFPSQLGRAIPATAF